MLSFYQPGSSRAAGWLVIYALLLKLFSELHVHGELVRRERHETCSQHCWGLWRRGGGLLPLYILPKGET